MKNVKTVKNLLMVTDVKDIMNFIESDDKSPILNNTDAINELVNGYYTKPRVLNFKFANRELACQWLKNNIEDYKKIRLTSPVRVILAIRY